MSESIGCLVCPPETRRPALHRGLCNGHYSAALKAVKAGEVTWEELIVLGHARPAKKIRQALHGWRDTYQPLT